MYCIKCAYPLAGLSTGACPECGREFDPARPSTFHAAPHGGIDRMLWRVALLPLAVPWLPVILSHVCLAAARIELGRWPHRMGRDDPKDLAVVGVLLAPTLLSLAAGFVGAPFAAVSLVAWSIAKGRARTAVHILLACTVSWAAAFALSRWDPADVWVWLFD